MKTKIMTIAFLAVTVVTSQLFAQELNLKSVEYDLKNNIKARVLSTETGFTIAFEYDTKSLTDVVAGKQLSKKGYDHYITRSDFSVSSLDNTITEVISPKDAASGLATGKRQHRPIGITQNIDKSTPVLSKEVTGNVTHQDTWSTNRSGGGAGKVSMQDISFTKRCGGNATVFSVTDVETLIPIDDCPNGVCDLKIEWTWNDGSVSTDIGSSGMDGVSRNSVNFSLTIEDGACTAMAINEKGLPGDKPRKTKSKN